MTPVGAAIPDCADRTPDSARPRTTTKQHGASQTNRKELSHMITYGHTELDLVATRRVQGMSQRQADYCLALVAAHLTHSSLDRDTFLRLADEAQAVTS